MLGSQSPPRKLLLLCLAGVLLLAACGGDKPALETGGPTEDSAGTNKDVERAVRGMVAAENKKDVDAFLAFWTDKGLKQYDVGSAEDLKAGKSENFGTDKIEILKFTGTKIDGKKASTTVDALVGDAKFAHPIERVKFPLTAKDGKWLLDGFEYLGGPPAAAGTPLINIEAKDYAFVLDKADTKGDFGFTFKNTGKEPHEITMFKAPDGVALPDAKTAIENVDGEDLQNVPPGYEADHVAFTEPGKKSNVTFAKPIPAGTYILACYIPEGGFNENGPVNPNGKPHVQLGMISMLKVS